MHAYTSKIENIVDPDQLALEKLVDLDLHCFQNRINPGSAGEGLSSDKFKFKSFVESAIYESNISLNTQTH